MGATGLRGTLIRVLAVSIHTEVAIIAANILVHLTITVIVDGVADLWRGLDVGILTIAYILTRAIPEDAHAVGVGLALIAIGAIITTTDRLPNLKAALRSGTANTRVIRSATVCISGKITELIRATANTTTNTTELRLLGALMDLPTTLPSLVAEAATCGATHAAISALPVGHT